MRFSRWKVKKFVRIFIFFSHWVSSFSISCYNCCRKDRPYSTRVLKIVISVWNPVTCISLSPSTTRRLPPPPGAVAYVRVVACGVANSRDQYTPWLPKRIIICRLLFYHFIITLATSVWPSTLTDHLTQSFIHVFIMNFLWDSVSISY